MAENLDGFHNLEHILIFREVLLQTRHRLMARQEIKPEEIEIVLGHPKATEECESWLSQHLPKIARRPFPSSAGAAREVSLNHSLKVTAIAPKTAAVFYDLTILASNIEDAPNNVTRLWVLGGETPDPTGNDKTTLYTQGELHPILHSLSTSSIVILSIYERPTGEGIDRHGYFINVKSHGSNLPLSTYLKQFQKVKWFGSYPTETLRCHLSFHDP